MPVLAQYTPPDRGLPGRREGGGTRGGTECVVGDRTLTAFIPETVFGTTTDASPKLYWYVPEINAPTLEFMLLDEAGNEVYLAEIPSVDGPGIISLEVPAEVMGDTSTSRLEENQNYRWFFSIVCNESDRSGDVYTEGWLRRVSLDPMLDEQIKDQPAVTQSDLYAQAGIWYDAMDAIAQAQCQQPNDPTVSSQWNSILTSVGLEGFVDEPVLFDCAE